MAVARTGVQLSWNNISASPRVLALWDHLTAGNVLASATLQWSPAPNAGDNAVFPVGSIEIAVPEGSFTAAVSDNLLRRALELAPLHIGGVGLYLALHTAAPPTTANQISANGDDRKSLLRSQWTITAS